MNKNKKFYSQPEAELLVIRFEQGLCTSPAYGSKGAAGAELDYNDYDVDF